MPLIRLSFGSLWSSFTFPDCILAIPASSAAVERIFSTSGESCTGKSNRLSGRNLEREALLKKNKELSARNELLKQLKDNQIMGSQLLQALHHHLYTQSLTSHR